MSDALLLMMLLFLFVRRGKGVVFSRESVMFWLLLMICWRFGRSGTTGLFRALRRSGGILVCCTARLVSVVLLRLFSSTRCERNSERSLDGIVPESREQSCSGLEMVQEGSPLYEPAIVRLGRLMIFFWKRRGRAIWW